MKKDTAYDFWKRVDDLNNSSLVALANATGIRYQRIKDQRSYDKYPTLIDTCLIANYLNTTVEFLTDGITAGNFCPEAIAVNSDPNLQCLVRLCLEDRQLFSVIKHLIRKDEEKSIEGGKEYR